VGGEGYTERGLTGFRLDIHEKTNIKVISKYCLVMTLTVDMPEGLEKEIETEVERGRYKNKSELVRDAIRRLLEERDKVEQKRISEEVMQQIREARSQEESYSLEEAKAELGV
jgi:putative addiction module CopG family antidote